MWWRLKQASYQKPIPVWLDRDVFMRGPSRPFMVVRVMENMQQDRKTLPYVIWLQTRDNPTQGLVHQIVGNSREEVLRRLSKASIW